VVGLLVARQPERMHFHWPHDRLFADGGEHAAAVDDERSSTRNVDADHVHGRSILLC
jgi:hypothetical protein